MSDTIQLHQRADEILRAVAGGAIWHRLLAQFPQLSLFLAGGALRDLLLGRECPLKDLDFFMGGADCEAALAQMAREGTLSYGPFGSPRWSPKARSDFYCDVIPIACFYNGLWPCADITDALNQFDFTANALALNLRSGEFHDPQNGRRDLTAKIMRAVRFDYPEEPIAPDQTLSRPAVVWFRLIHYAAMLGFEIEPVTARWLNARRGWVALSAEFETTFFRLDPRAEVMLDSIARKHGN